MSLPNSQPVSEPSDNRPFAAKGANRLMTARELAIFTEEKVKGLVTDKDMAHIPWESNLSDHLMQSYFDGKDIRVATWNVLNPKYIKHLAKREDPDVPGVDMSQRLHNMPFASAGYAAHRLPLIADIVLCKVFEGYVVCLQEVGPDLVQRINDNLNAFRDRVNHIEIVYQPTVEFGKSAAPANCNVTMWDTARYTKSGETRIFAPACGTHYGILPVITLQTSQTYRRFDVVNVHVAFGKNAEYAEALLTAYTDRPAFVAGDFNATCRFPRREGGKADHIMECYGDARFLFAAENDEPYFSHVNTFENTRDCRLQLDKFDHILAINNELLTNG